MRYLKYFESLYKPKVGDYVVADKLYLAGHFKNFEDFVENNVGIVTYISKDPIFYQIEYYDVPQDLKSKFSYNGNEYKTNIYDIDDSRKKIRLATPEEIEEFEAKRRMNKFNL